MLFLVRIALVLFAIILLQQTFFHEVRSILRSDLQFSASLSMSINSDISCLPAIMASDASKLHFDEFPTEPLDISQWFSKCLLTTQDFQGRVRNADNEQENYSLQSIFLIGFYWNLDELIWSADEANIRYLTADAILEHTPDMPVDEQALLREDEVLMLFNHAPTHRKAQISLRRALLDAFPEGHSLYYRVQSVNKAIGAADLYQGSRLLLALREIVAAQTRSERPIFSNAAMRISRELVTLSDASATQFHEAIFLLEKHINILSLVGHAHAEQEFVTDFIEQMLHHPKPLFVTLQKTLLKVTRIMYPIRLRVYALPYFIMCPFVLLMQP
jgi:hypothetical protein